MRLLASGERGAYKGRMSEDAKTGSTGPEGADKNALSEAIQSILDEGEKVRDRIQQVVAGSVNSEEFSVANLGKAAREVMAAAYQNIGDAVTKAVPKESEGALRDVVYGLGDAFGTAARSAGSAFEAATKQGKEFASDDVKRVTKELSDLGSTFVSAIADASKTAAGQAAEFANQASTHATKAAEDMKPHVESALTAAALHPVQLTKEAAQAGIDVSKQVAGSLFSVLGEFMNKAADAMKSADGDKAR